MKNFQRLFSFRQDRQRDWGNLCSINKTKASIRSLRWSLCLLALLASQGLMAQSTWTGASSSVWTDAANWTGGVPTDGGDVIITSGAFDPVMDQAHSFNKFTISSGNLNLGGFALSITKDATFSGGQVLNGNITVNSTSAGRVTFKGGAIIDGLIDVKVGALVLSGAVFKQQATLEKVGTTIDYGNGGNIFHADVTLRNAGGNALYLAYQSPDIFKQDVLLENTATGSMYVATVGKGNQFEGDIRLSNSGNTWLSFGGLGGTSQLSATSQIREESSGAIAAGTLELAGLDILTDFNLNIPAVTLFLGRYNSNYGGNGSHFHGTVNASAGGIRLNGSEFDKVAVFEKKDGNPSYGAGGNTFHEHTTIRNSGSNTLILGYIYADTFKKDVLIENASTGSTYLAYMSKDNQFEGDIRVINPSGTWVSFGNNGGTAQLAASSVVVEDSPGSFAKGNLELAGMDFPSDLTLNLPDVSVFFGRYNSNYGGNGSHFHGLVNVSAGSIRLNGSEFDKESVFENTGTGVSYGTGGNTFHEQVTLRNSGTSSLIMGFRAADTFKKDVVVENTATGSTYLAHISKGNQFEGNIRLSKRVTSWLTIGEGGGTSQLSATSQIMENTPGSLEGGNVVVAGIDYPSDVSWNYPEINLTLGRYNSTYGGNGNHFHGTVNVIAKGIALNGSTFDKVADFKKVGGNIDYGTGGNTFHENVSIHNAGSNSLFMAFRSGDTFKKDVLIENSATGSTYMSYIGANTQFEGDIRLINSTNSWITFGESSGTSQLSATSQIMEDSPGSLASGSLVLAGMDVPVDVNLSIPGVDVYFGRYGGQYGGNGSHFHGLVNLIAEGIQFNGSTFDKEVVVEKRGGSVDYGTGSNTFHEKVTIHNAGSNTLFTAFRSGDTFKKDVLIENSATGSTYMSYIGTGNQFEGDIRLINSTNSWITFGESTGTSQLSATSQIMEDSPGSLASGSLVLGGMDIPSDVSLDIAGVDVYFGRYGGQYGGNGSDFHGTVNVIAEGIQFNGSTFDKEVVVEKRGGSVDYGTGSNTFHEKVTIHHAGSNSLCMAFRSGDTFKKDVLIENSATGSTYMSYIGANTQFEGDIRLINSTNSWITFGESSGTSQLSATSQIMEDSPGSLASGSLVLAGMDIPSDVSLDIDGVDVYFGRYGGQYGGNGSHFHGLVNLIAEGIQFNGSTFDKEVVVEKRGGSVDYGTGGNTFNEKLTIRNFSVSGNLITGFRNNHDTYNGELIVENTNNGQVQIGLYNTNEFHGDITASATSGGFINFIHSVTGSFDFSHNLILNTLHAGRIQFGVGGGVVALNGSADQSITHLGLSKPAHIYQLKIDKPSGKVQLQTELEIKKTLDFNNGMTKTTGDGLLIIDSGVALTGASNTRYVSGKVQKKGNQDFTFPIGDDNSYRPLSMAGVSSAGPITAYYVKANQPTGDNTGSCHIIDDCEHWVVDNVGSASNFTPAINTNTSCTLPANPDLMWYNGTDWEMVPATLDVANQVFTANQAVSSLANTTHYLTYGSLTDVGEITEEIDVCDSFLRTYHVREVAGATYQWTLPTGFSISSGSGTHEITVVINNTATVGANEIQVSYSTATCTAQASKLTVNVGSFPNNPTTGNNLEAYLIGTKTNKAEAGYKLHKAPNGGWLLQAEGNWDKSTGTLIKLDENYQTEWAKTFGNPGEPFWWTRLTPTTDGYFFAHANDKVIGKLDLMGNLVWIKKVTTVVDKFVDINATPDNGFIISGSIHSNVFGYYKASDLYIAKFDALGNEEWIKMYGHGEDMMFWEGRTWSAVTSDGGYMLSGRLRSVTNSSLTEILIKTKPNGDIEFSKLYGFGLGNRGSDQLIGEFVPVEGGYLFGGGVNKGVWGNRDAIAMKVDNAGNILWAKAFGDQAKNGFAAPIELSDGYLFADLNSPNNFVKLDKSGSPQLQWQKKLDADVAIWGHYQNGDNLVFTGGAGYVDNQWDILLFESDKDLNMPFCETSDAYNMQSFGIQTITGYEAQIIDVSWNYQTETSYPMADVTSQYPTEKLSIAIPVAEAAGVITGETSVCTGSSYTYTVPAIAHATSYEWTLPTGIVQVGTGATGTISTQSNTIEVTIANGFEKGGLSVRGINNLCKQGVPSCLGIFNNPEPVANLQLGNHTVCDDPAEGQLKLYAEGSSYTLYKDGAVYAGYQDVAITNAPITIDNLPAGNYQVVVKSGTCVATSSSISIRNITGEQGVMSLVRWDNVDYSESANLVVNNLGEKFVVSGINGASIQLGTFNLQKQTAWNDGVFVMKYTGESDVVWARKIEANQLDLTKISTDELGNSFVVGRYIGTVTFEGSTESFTSVGNGGNLFVIKYNANGQVVWVKNNLTSQPHSDIVSDAQGNTYVFVDNEGLYKYDPNGNMVANSTGEKGVTHNGDVYVLSTAGVAPNGTDLSVLLKYDQAGNYIWHKQITGYSGMLYDVKVSDNEEVCILGKVEGGAIAAFETSSGYDTLSIIGEGGNYIAKYTTSGEYLSAKQLVSYDNGNFFGEAAMKLDAQGNAYMLGSIQGTVNFGTEPVNGRGSDYQVLGKFDATGNFMWVEFAGPAYSYGQSLLDLATDAQGQAYIAFFPSYATDIEFGNKTTPSTDNAQLFIGKVGYLTRDKLTGTPKIEGDTLVCIDDTKEYVVTGVTNAIAYQWTLPEGTSTESGVVVTTSPEVIIETTTDTISINFGANAVSDTLWVRAMDQCDTTEYAILPIKIKEPTDITKIEGDTLFCVAENAIATGMYQVIDTAGIDTFIWDVKPGYMLDDVTPATINGVAVMPDVWTDDLASFKTTSDAINFNFDTTGVFVDAITVVGKNCCGDFGAPASINLQLHPQPKAQLFVHEKLACSESDVTATLILTTEQTEASTYELFKVGETNAILTGNVSLDQNPTSDTLGVFGFGDYYIQVKDDVGCIVTSSTVSIAAEVDSEGNAVLNKSISLESVSSESVCQGNEIDITFNTVCIFGEEFVAQMQVGNDIISLGNVTGEGNLTITGLIPSTVPAGTYPLWVESLSGVKSNSVQVEVKFNAEHLVNIGAINGFSSLCLDVDITGIYVLDPAPAGNIEEYHWTIGGTTYITTTNRFEYKFYQKHTVAESPLTLSVFVKNACGQSAATSLDIELKEGKPLKPTTVGGVYCENVTFNMPANFSGGPASKYYHWKHDALPAGIQITGWNGTYASNSDIFITQEPFLNIRFTNNTTEDLSFPMYLRGVNDCGVGEYSDPVTITVKWTPDVNLSANVGYTSCFNATDGSLSVSTNGTKGIYTLEKYVSGTNQWEPYNDVHGRDFTDIAFDVNAGQPFPTGFDQLGTGLYRVALTAPNNCVSYSPTVLIQDGSPSPAITCSSYLPCEGTSTGKIEFNMSYLGMPSDFAGSYSYEIIRSSDLQLMTSGVFTHTTSSITIDNIQSVEPGVNYVLRVSANLQGSDPNCTTCTNPYCEVMRVFSFASPSPNVLLQDFRLKDDLVTKAYYLCVSESGATVPYSLSATVNDCSMPIENYQVILSDAFGNTFADDSYTYSGNEIDRADLTFTDLPVGEYTVKFIAGTSNYKCETEESFEVIRLDDINIKVNTTAETCANAEDGTAQVVVSGVSGAVTYEWFSRASTSDAWTAILGNYQSSSLNNLAPGEYRVELVMVGYDHCNDIFKEFSIDAHKPSVESIEKPHNILPNGEFSCDPSVNAKLAADHVQGIYQFAWSRCTGGNCESATLDTYEAIFTQNLQSTDATPELILTSALNPELFEDSSYYYVTVTDPNGCAYQSEKAFLVKPAIERTYEISLSWESPDPTPRKKVKKYKSNFAAQAKQAAEVMRNVANDCVLSKEAVAGRVIRESCLNPKNIKDELTIACSKKLHHYTLYYYDRAGALTKTVPPEGVRYLDKDADLQGKWQRIQGVRPDHKLTTTYNYNNLGQLISQNTPDGGESKFIYNTIGQLRYSQNARQAADNTYSYTIYDRLGKPIEAGESKSPGPNFAFALIQDNDVLANDMTFPSVTSDNEQQTITVYSEAAPTDKNVWYCSAENTQRYLQNRVSYTYTYNKGEKDNGVYAYYSYDPHGNVEWIIQDIPGFGRSILAYEYDLISGKVLKVRFNECRPDQFYHKYEYDEDNRLVAVYTSYDNHLWDKDANYQYYAHGPLKRTELGEDAIQGLDYVYTIHGWIKGVNGPDAEGDVSGDGQSENSRFAADEWGMTLGYYQGDYKNKTQAGISSVFESSLSNIHNMQPKQDLYNGNISTWASHMNQQSGTAMQYSYDKLNRIKTSERHNWNDAANAWELTGNGNVYRTAYTYDGNGNLDSLVRFDAKGEMLDNLKYVYENELNGEKLTNKLKKVIENASVTAYGKDIESTTHDTEYVYDEIGNLIEDRRDSIAVEWNVQDKVHKVKPLFGAIRPVIRYHYDATGNRIMKEVDRGVVEFESPDSIRTTYYVRDADGNIMSTYERRNVVIDEATGEYEAEFRQKEVMLYGSDRLGMYQVDTLLAKQRFMKADFKDVNMDIANLPMNATSLNLTRRVGKKQYELKDHLGNVRVVVTDGKVAVLNQAGTDIDSLNATVMAYNNYYPFGMEMPEGTYQNTEYRFGFNGKENDREWGTGGLTQDYGFRLYNPVLAKFLSVDPLAPEYPWYTPYQFAGNMPIQATDLDGLEPDLIGGVDYGGYAVPKGMTYVQVKRHLDRKYKAILSKLFIKKDSDGKHKPDYNRMSSFFRSRIKMIRNIKDEQSKICAFESFKKKWDKMKHTQYHVLRNKMYKYLFFQQRQLDLDAMNKRTDREYEIRKQKDAEAFQHWKNNQVTPMDYVNLVIDGGKTVVGTISLVRSPGYRSGMFTLNSWGSFVGDVLSIVNKYQNTHNGKSYNPMVIVSRTATGSEAPGLIITGAISTTGSVRTLLTKSGEKIDSWAKFFSALSLKNAAVKKKTKKIKK